MSEIKPIKLEGEEIIISYRNLKFRLLFSFILKGEYYIKKNLDRMIDKKDKKEEKEDYPDDGMFNELKNIFGI